LYRGPNATKVFVEEIREEVMQIENIYDEEEEILPLTKE
jgi:hypothetical protein